jgi:hypothetical protein
MPHLGKVRPGIWSLLTLRQFLIGNPRVSKMPSKRRGDRSPLAPCENACATHVARAVAKLED